jgi:hypothetical protein
MRPLISGLLLALAACAQQTLPRTAALAPAAKLCTAATCAAGAAVGGSYLAEAPIARQGQSRIVPVPAAVGGQSRVVEATTTTASTAAGIDPTAAPYDAAGNGTTNDFAALQKACTAAAAAGSKLLLGGHIFAFAGTVTGGCPISGPGAITEQTAAIDALVVPNTAQGTSLSDFTCYAPSGSTAGACIHDEGYRTAIEDVTTVNGCIGIDDDDPWGAYFSNVYVWYGQIAPGCRGLRVGHGTLSQGSTITNLNVGAPPGVANTYAIEIIDAGGALFLGGNMQAMGTLIDPGNGQTVAWTQFVGTVVGDTLPGSSLTVQPGAGGLVQGLTMQAGVWGGQAGYCAGLSGCPASGFNPVPSIVVNAAAGAIKGMHFNALRLMSGLGGDGIYAVGPNLTDLTVESSVICGVAGAAIELGQGVGASIEDSKLNSGCDSAQPTPNTAALKLDGGNVVLYTGNDMTGSQGVVGTPAAGSIMTENLGP